MKSRREWVNNGFVETAFLRVVFVTGLGHLDGWMADEWRLPLCRTLCRSARFL